MDDAHRRLLARAEDLEGLVPRRETRGLGLTRDAVANLLDAGDFERHGPRLLRRTGSPATTKQRVLAAVLDAGPGAYLSYDGGVAWWGLPGFGLRVLDVTRPRGITSTRPTFARLHEVVTLLSDHVTELDGVPILRPERCFIDVCASGREKRAERMLDNAWSRGLLSGRSTRKVLDDLAASGRNGIVLARKLLDARPDDYVPPASGLEARLSQVLGEAGLQLRRQVDCGAERWSGRVDFRLVDRPVVIEVQSERYHASLSDRLDDARRRAQLETDGFVVVEVWDVDVWHRPRHVLQQVLAADLRARGRKSGAKTRWGQAS